MKKHLGLGQASMAASTKADGYRRMPRHDEIKLSPNSAYVHLTSNETIQGIQWHSFPDVGDRPLISDMSSDIVSRPFDASKFSLIYAGAQKNLGPAGVTVVLIRESLLEKANKKLPTMLRYGTHVKNNSLVQYAAGLRGIHGESRIAVDREARRADRHG